jgi:hypothetical protein
MIEFRTSRHGAFVLSTRKISIVSDSESRNFVIDHPDFSLTMTRSIIALFWGRAIGWKRYQYGWKRIKQ